MIEIRAREICPECKGTGHVPGGKRFETCPSCVAYGAHGFIERWVSIADLNLSLEITQAIQKVFAAKQ